MFLSVFLILCAVPASSAKGRLRQFYAGPSLVNITQAQTLCNTSYTGLATVYDKYDNVNVNALIYGLGWIGARTGGLSVKWSDGADFTYNRSFTGACGDSCCAAMNSSGDWLSRSCSETSPFMCYKRDGGRDSINYTLVQDHKSWSDAQQFCRETYTDLVSIRDETENDLVKEEGHGGTFWIGLLEDNVHWADGGHSAYRNYTEPPGDGYTIMNPDMHWSNDNTVNEYVPFCYKSFIHVSDDVMSWEGAVDYCDSQTDTAGLLRIESEDDQIETERELQRRNISGPVWVGLKQSRVFGFWIWVNGLHVGPWTYWVGGSQPPHPVSHHCGAIERLNGYYKWIDKDCMSQFTVLCERKKRMPPK